MQLSKDTLQQTLHTAQKNSESTLRSFPGVTTLLEHIHATFVSVNEALINSPDWFLVMFFGRAHSALVGAVRLITSGQSPETYMLLRGALENAMYALYIHSDPQLQKRAEMWLRRNESKESKDLVVGSFKMANLKATLRTRNARIAQVTETLYERCIDLGGHPNQQGHFAAAAFQQVGDTTEFQVQLFADQRIVRILGLKTTTEVGLAVLHVFREIYETRFQLAGITDAILQLEKLIEPTFRPFYGTAA